MFNTQMTNSNQQMVTAGSNNNRPYSAADAKGTALQAGNDCNYVSASMTNQQMMAAGGSYSYSMTNSNQQMVAAGVSYPYANRNAGDTKTVSAAHPFATSTNVIYVPVMPLPIPTMLSSHPTNTPSKRKRTTEELTFPTVEEHSHQSNAGLDLLSNVSANYSSPEGRSLSLCRCVKSRCLKLYCDCFRGGNVCNVSCSCAACLNSVDESGEHGERTKAIHLTLRRRPHAFQTREKTTATNRCSCKNSK
jgi:hypothetical protein